MDNRSSIRTVGYVAGIAVLLIVLFLVAGISTGVLPWRDSYAENPWPTKNPDTVVAEPTATPDGTGTPAPAATPTPTVIAKAFTPMNLSSFFAGVRIIGRW